MSDSFRISVPGHPGAPPQPTTEPIRFPACAHARTELRKMTQSNKVVVAVSQCLDCGQNCGAVRKEVAIARAGSVTGLPAFDEELRKRWQEQASRRWEEAHADRRATEQREWWSWYSRYLASPEWSRVRAAALARDGGLCQGCRVRKAVEVHHLTYARVGREMLFDLVSVCEECHQRIHPEDAP